MHWKGAYCAAVGGVGRCVRLVGDYLASGFPNWFKLPPQTANTVPCSTPHRGGGRCRISKIIKPLTSTSERGEGERARERHREQRVRETVV